MEKEIFSDTFVLLSDTEKIIQTQMELDRKSQAYLESPNNFSTEEHQALLDEHSAFTEKLAREIETLKNLCNNKN